MKLRMGKHGENVSKPLLGSKAVRLGNALPKSNGNLLLRHFKLDRMKYRRERCRELHCPGVNLRVTFDGSVITKFQ